MARLGENRLVIAPDTPGYGESDGPPEPVSIEAYAAAAAELMAGLAADEFGEGAFDVMGVHTGAVLATELARSRPAQVRRAVLVGLAGYDAEARAEKLRRLEAYPRPKEDLSHVEAVWRVMQALFDPRTNVAWRHRSLAENIRSGAAMSWGYDAVYRYDLLAALREVRQPVLVINPEDDLAALTPAAARRLPNARRLDWPGAKHGFLAVDADGVAEAVAAFLNDV